MERRNRVVILGAAGAQARTCIEYLLHVSPCEIVLVDRDGPAVVALAEALAAYGHRVVARETDLADREEVRKSMQGAAVVGNFVGPFYRWGPVAASMAIECGDSYVDICDDDRAAIAMLNLTEDARAAGLTVLTGLGAGPGVTNILAGVCAGNLDTVDEVEFGWFASGHPESAGPAAFNHLLWGFATPFEVLTNGECVNVGPFDEAFSRIVSFPEPFGAMTLWAFPHPEPVTFAHFIPGLRTAINRGAVYPGRVMDVIRSWQRLGYADDKPLTIGGARVDPAEFAVQHFVERGVRILDLDTMGPRDASGMHIRVAGVSGGHPREYRIRASTDATMASETGVPAGVGIAMLLAGEVDARGTIAPECLAPGAFFERFARRRRENTTSGALTIEVGEGDAFCPVRLRDLVATYRSPIRGGEA
jgi:lysine 6-dehydrogenase